MSPYEKITICTGDKDLCQLIDDNVRIICGKDGKPDANMITSISEGIAKGDPINIYDPLNVDQVIKNLEREIEDFRDNVDFALSESNAVTQITV